METYIVVCTAVCVSELSSADKWMMCVWFARKWILCQLFRWCTSIPGSWSSPVEHISLYLQPTRAVAYLHACVVTLPQMGFLSQQKAQRSFCAAENRHRPFCVRMNQWKDEPASSEDGHTMPWVQLMLICARPWWWSKWRCDSSSGSNAQSHNFHTTPWKHVKPKRWNRWKDYSLLILCCPSPSYSCQ